MSIKQLKRKYGTETISLVLVQLVQQVAANTEREAYVLQMAKDLKDALSS